MRPLSDSFTAILSLNSNFTSLVNSVPLLLSKYVSKTSSRSPNFHVLPSIVDDTPKSFNDFQSSLPSLSLNLREINDVGSPFLNQFSNTSPLSISIAKEVKLNSSGKVSTV